jgi:hypothetical protein
LSLWRDLSVIFLAVTAAVLGLVPMAVCGVIVYGLRLLARHENLPAWLQISQGYVTTGRQYVRRVMRLAASPIVFVHTVLAAAESLLRFGRPSGGER